MCSIVHFSFSIPLIDFKIIYGKTILNVEHSISSRHHNKMTNSNLFSDLYYRTIRSIDTLELLSIERLNYYNSYM